VAADPPPIASSAPPSAGPASPTIRGTPITSLDRLRVGDAVEFSDPAQGPAVLVRLSKSGVAAYSRVCTHAGCLVDYDPQARLLVCPCHGAEFDPAHSAQPVAGPAFLPLARIPIAVDASGTIVATR
jgi:Rieske Fe-S protein